MILGEVFRDFVRESPVTVMLRGVFEYALSRDFVDDLFRRHAQRQCENELLFSTVVNVLSLAVTQKRKSVNAAYKAEDIQVSVRALYDKLQKTEPQVCQALVRESAERLAPLVRMLGTRPALLPGYHTKILDGKHLNGTEHRLKETRSMTSSPLPGHLLVVLDPQLGMAIDAFPCEDAYVQERALLGEVLETVTADDLWIGDRNFCTTNFLFGIARCDAFFLIRQHGSTLSGKRLKGRKKRVGRCKTGVVYEQTLEIKDRSDEDTMTLRRISIKLDKPTRDGDREIHLLTNLPDSEDAITVAMLYLQRWKIEELFGELTQSFDAEMKTLCYPPAALFAYCLALVTHQMISVLKSALHAAHGDRAELQKLSTYYLSEEVTATYRGMLIAIADHHWQRAFEKLTTRQMADILLELAQHTNVSRYQKSQRKTRNPPTPRRDNSPHRHVSTQRILNQRTAQC